MIASYVKKSPKLALKGLDVNLMYTHVTTSEFHQ